jgi:hypothetical protein
VDIAIVMVWVVIMAAIPWLGLLLVPVAIFLAVAPDIVTLRRASPPLRHDVVNRRDRSLRIRRGIWVIHETTITFENAERADHRGPCRTCLASRRSSSTRRVAAVNMAKGRRTSVIVA